MLADRVLLRIRLTMVRLGWIGMAPMWPDNLRTMLLLVMVVVVIVCCVPRPIPISNISARYIIAQQGSEQRTFESN